MTYNGDFHGKWSRDLGESTRWVEKKSAESSFGINGIIHVHQLRNCHFFAGYQRLAMFIVLGTLRKHPKFMLVSKNGRASHPKRNYFRIQTSWFWCLWFSDTSKLRITSGFAKNLSIRPTIYGCRTQVADCSTGSGSKCKSCVPYRERAVWATQGTASLGRRFARNDEFFYNLRPPWRVKSTHIAR